VSPSLRYALISAAALALLTGACARPSQPPAPAATTPPQATQGAGGQTPLGWNLIPPPSNDDRPPIIIGDGSVDMYIDPYNGYTGSWLDKNGDGKTWVHMGDQTVKILHFDLTLLNPKASGNYSCDFLKVYGTEQLTIDYTGSKKVTIKPDGGNLVAVFEESAAKDVDYAIWVFVAGNLKLQSVTFREKGQMSDTVCQFTGRRRGTVTIHQSKDALATHPDPVKPAKKD
jgi:hypothetical protein